MLLDLSAGLLQEIAGELTQPDHAVLRAVCKDLNSAVCPLFFSRLVLKIKRHGMMHDTVQKLEALASGATGWSFYAKTLRIDIPVLSNYHLNITAAAVDNARLASLLGTALASLPRIQTVMSGFNSYVHLDHGFLDWGQTTVFTFLNKLDDLRELELNIPSTNNLSALHRVRGLHKFALKSIYHDTSLLRVMSGNAISTVPGIAVPGIAELLSQNQLRSLHLEGPAEWSPLWRMLPIGTHCMQLAELTTNRVNEGLFSHLSAYSGLRKLRLVAPDGGNLTMSDHLADIFFATVLPRHADSLVELACAAAFEGRFSFGEHNVRGILQLQKLTSLEYVWGPRGEPAEAEQAAVDRVVTLLLQTAAGLPALRSLTISAAEAEHQRNMQWNKMNHIVAVNVAIANAVEAFRTQAPCEAVICAGKSVRILPTEDGTGKRSTARYPSTTANKDDGEREKQPDMDAEPSALLSVYNPGEYTTDRRSILSWLSGVLKNYKPAESKVSMRPWQLPKSQLELGKISKHTIRNAAKHQRAQLNERHGLPALSLPRHGGITQEREVLAQPLIVVAPPHFHFPPSLTPHLFRRRALAQSSSAQDDDEPRSTRTSEPLDSSVGNDFDI
ncbi:F-box domain-containing protein [Mycena sanguinolenta]|uniref:F-box domain-containing protein n=1 Tax=Mycena sanguinolenta TaxID=230812 RepID=A0A8H7CV38_9AGAR|nr:F-box domain-containing protein [Mycena sanguinolenta]